MVRTLGQLVVLGILYAGSVFGFWLLCMYVLCLIRVPKTSSAPKRLFLIDLYNYDKQWVWSKTRHRWYLVTVLDDALWFTDLFKHSRQVSESLLEEIYDRRVW